MSQFPSDSGESDDPDGDGFNNHSEWYSGTDPTQTDSRLELELTANPTLLDPTDQTPIEASQHAVYFQSVPGRYYGLQRALVLEGNYELVAVRIAGRNQTRFVVPAMNPLMFYRVVVLP